MHQLDPGVAVKCFVSRQHFVEDHAEIEYVRAVIDRGPANLLGRHIADRSHNYAGTRDCFTCRVLGTACIGFGTQFCQAEVEYLYTVVFRDEKIFGF